MFDLDAALRELGKDLARWKWASFSREELESLIARAQSEQAEESYLEGLRCALNLGTFSAIEKEIAKVKTAAIRAAQEA